MVADTSGLEIPSGSEGNEDAIRLQWQRRLDESAPWQDIGNTNSSRYNLPRGVVTGTSFKVVATHIDSWDRTSRLDSEIHVLSNFVPALDDVAFSIPEDTGPNASLGQLAADDYNDEPLAYSIEAGNEEQLFDLDAETGELSLVRTGLDFESINAYFLTVRVTDGVDGTLASVRIDITDINEAPLAHAGTDQTVAEGVTVTLDARSSTDPDHRDSLTWQWTAPEGITLQQADNATPTFDTAVDLVQDQDIHTLDFSLQVTDTAGLTATDTVTVTVQRTDNGPATGSLHIAREELQLSLQVTDLNDLDGLGQQPDSIAYQWQHRQNADSPWTDISDAHALQYGWLCVQDHSYGPWTDIPDAHALQYLIPPGTGRTAQFQAVVTLTDQQGYVSTLISPCPVTMGNVPPRFQQAGYAFALPENSSALTPVGTVSALDFNHDTLRYAITSGNVDQAFAIEPQTGVLSVNREILNHEELDRYQLVVEVTDDMAADSIPVTVTVTNVNEPPQAVVSLSQAVQEGDIVTLDGAASADVDVDDTLAWQWMAPAGIILPQADTAQLVFTVPTDLVTTGDTRNLPFTLQVIDAQGLTATDTVTLTVHKINNGDTTGDVTVQRDNTRLTLKVAALTDPDGTGTADSNTTYQWQHRPDTDSPWTDIPDAQTLQYLIPAGTARSVQFQAVVTHTDQQGYTSTLVSAYPVTMGNVPPRFQQDSYSFTLPENSPALTPVGTVAADDFNLDTLQYTITDGNPDRIWHIDPQTGVVAVEQALLDHEELGQYHLTVEVSDDAATVAIPVAITVTNVNESPQAVAGLPQAVQEGDTVTLDGTASSDVDIDDTLTWQWTAPEGITLQQADTVQPLFTAPTDLVTAGETRDLLFTLQVADAQGLTATDTVTLTVHKIDNGDTTGDITVQRDNTRLDLDVSGLADPDGLGQQPDSTAYQWQHRPDSDSPWTDIPDAQTLQYLIPAGTARSVQFQAVVTHTDQQGYISTLIASRPVTMGNVTPRFQQDSYSFALPENSPALTPVGMVSARDFNHDTLRYAIASGNRDQAFTIEPQTGVLSVNREILDHEGLDRYQLAVEVTDDMASASIPVTVTVTNVNEPPQAVAGLPQTVQEGDTVTLDGTASADVDADDTLAWQWTAPEGITLQQVDTPEPVLAIPLDLVTTDETRELSFTLEVTDAQGLAATDTVTLTVRKIDNGNTTGDVTVQRDDTQLTLNISGLADPDGLGQQPDSTAYQWQHRPDTDSPWADIPDAHSLQYLIPAGTARAVQFQAVVTHTDQQGYASTLVSPRPVTMGNVPPYFQQARYSFALPENSPALTPVGTIAALDFNHDTLRYAIASGNGDQIFAIEPQTGVLSVKRAVLNHEELDQYQLAVEVTDDMASDSIPVTVTVTNVNEPPQAVAGISQTVQEGDTVTLDGTASTDVDIDDTLAWQWTAPEGITLPQADTAQPVFTVPTDLVTTGETRDLSFTLQVTDTQGLTATDMVTLTVGKIDNGDTTGDLTIHRDSTQLTLAVAALTDPDGAGTADSSTYQWQRRQDIDSPWTDVPDAHALQYLIPAGTARSVQFQAVVTHTDRQGYASTLVSPRPVTMGNVPPYFQHARYAFTLPENSPALTPVGTVSALDFNHDTLRYAIASGNGDQAFTIEPQTGVLSVNREILNHEELDQYQLAVEVTDDMTVDAIPVTVTITNVNEPPQAVAGLPQTVQEGDTVTLDGTTSSDVDVDDTLAWQWTAPEGITLPQTDTAQPVFTVPTDLVTTGDTQELSFTLKVTDAQGLTATDTVTLTVHKIDNGNTTGDVVIHRDGIELTLEVSGLDDPDEISTDPKNTAYRWRCRHDADGPWTDIHGATDTRLTIPAGTAGSVQFQALVLHTDDQGYISALVSTNIIIMGNVPPRFLQDRYVLAVPENSVVGAPVGSIEASDFNLDELAYRIAAGNDQDIFHLEASTGNLSVNRARLDHEELAQHHLTVEVSDGVATVAMPVAITVTNVNEPPQAVAGHPQTVQEGDTVTLDGTASTDVDIDDTLAWQWTAPADITLPQADTAQPVFTVPVNLVTTGETRELPFTLQVTDAQGLTATDTVTLTVHKIDNGNTTGNVTVHRDNTRLDLEVSGLDDPDGLGQQADSTTSQWQRRQDADSPWTDIPDAHTLQYLIPAGTARSVRFQAVVTHIDQQGYISTLVSPRPVTMGNVPPRVQQASYTLAIPENTPPQTLVVVVEVSDFNGDPLAYRIARGNFNQAFAIDPDTGALRIARDSLDYEARYQYRLTIEVTDGLVVQTIPVLIRLLDINEAPLAHAGTDQTVAEGVTVTLDARSSTDPDHRDSLTWQWTAPADITLRQADTATPTFNTAVDLVQDQDIHTLDFSLQVTDTAGLTATDTVTVTVQRTDNGPATGSLHIAHEQLQLSLQLTDLDDPDGLGQQPDSTAYQWQLKSDAISNWRNLYQANDTQYEIPLVVEPGSLYRAIVTHTDQQGFTSSLFSNVIDLAASIAATTSTHPSLHAVPPQEACVIPVFDLGTLRVTDNLYIVTSGETGVGHNIPNLELALYDRETSIAVNFKDFFLSTGGLSRWGYPTSEVVVLEHNVLTQYYEQGVVSFRFTGKSEWLQRNLLWDYLGAGLWGLADQASEPHVLNPHAGEKTGPWSHKVSNYAVDGTWTGFADFFARHGGVRSFGYPRTDARPDTDDPDMVSGALVGLPSIPGVIRQYFQAAILEYDPATNTIRIPALGNTVRDLLVPHHASLAPFVHAPSLHVSQDYFPFLILSCTAQE